jgi:c(7)-type cytochrome triheme protein
MAQLKKFCGGALLLGGATLIAMMLNAGESSHAADGDEAPASNRTETGELRFGHEFHKGKGVAIDDCSTCHGIKGFEIEPVTRGKDHKPCNNETCHASEYMSREPKICVVCHDTNEPWVKQVARIRDMSSSEFGGEISHKTHQSDKASKGGVKCESCHGNVYEKGDKPEAHAVCGSCHQDGLEPTMDDCGSCHKLGYQESRRKSGSRYAVRARFDHSDHDSDPREKKRVAPKCTTCHTGVAKAEKLNDIPAPTMQSCDACHDGEHAFKTTGFGCVKCHGDATP